uniref:Uncharacterized protein n=1 Tax=Aegilops tauschii subsp. strangulata TaxID=200361 RepID=A0A452Z9L1_AEGTS
MAAPPSQASLLLQKQLRDLAKNPVDGFSRRGWWTTATCLSGRSPSSARPKHYMMEATSMQ